MLIVFKYIFGVYLLFAFMFILFASHVECIPPFAVGPFSFNAM